MGNSTISIQNVLDYAAAKGIPVPTDTAAGYGPALALRLANNVMSDIIAERFNWKWNRTTASPFYTNSFQQDYPQVGLTTVGWLEDCDRVDINNTSFPKPLRQLTVRRGLSRMNGPQFRPVAEICWMYNSDLSYGTWPGANQTFYPLVSGQVKQNPIMSMIDANGNLLIMTSFQNNGSDVAVTTGTVAPLLAANSAEGTTVMDGSVQWTVVSPNSQGFRVYPLPAGSGPVWQVTPYYQNKAVTLTTLQSLINPIPDDYSRFFQNGYEAYCLQSSPNPADKAKFQAAWDVWIASMAAIRKQGDREADSYAMLPATSPVESVWEYTRNPQDPSQPY